MSTDVSFDPSHEAKAVHYHGDGVRLLFVIIAISVFLTQFIGTKLPYTTPLIMLIVVVLVVAAGITNPAQRWIHWVNLFISIAGLLLFGGLALERFTSTDHFISHNTLIAIIAILFISALYLCTRTIRGLSVAHVDPDAHGEY